LLKNYKLYKLFHNKYFLTLQFFIIFLIYETNLLSICKIVNFSKKLSYKSMILCNLVNNYVIYLCI